MEYFAKFTRRMATPKRSPPGGGTSQLAKFEKAWKTAQAICTNQSKWRGIPVDKTPLPAQLVIMFDLLVQEDIRQADTDDSTTGACMEYLLGNGILESLVQLAESDQPPGVRGVVIRNLSTFVSLTDDKLLVQKAVHNPILELLRSYATLGSSNEAHMSQSIASLFNTRLHVYDDDFVDLLYSICSKIRGEPMLLNIFFQDRKWLKSIEQRSISSESITAMMRSVESLRSLDGGGSSGGDGDGGRSGSKPEASSTYEFLLFSHLLQFIHLEGKAGDTARTSLLFLLELATTEIMASTGGNTALERFILDDSGFSAILSATLGALYSQLPRSLRVTSGPAAVVPESFPSYSADLQNAIESSIFSASGDRGASMDFWAEEGSAVSSSSPEFRARLSAFAHLFGFVQDVLFRCPSAHVCSQLLRNIRENFLQSILYPSILESSDTDGSSVAVMRYLETILQVVRHEDLVSTVMDFLTDESAPGDLHDYSQALSTPMRQLKATQMDVATDNEAGPASGSPDSGCLPFTLRDLVYTNLQSSVSNDAVVSALNLLRIILSKHCRYSARLIEVERAQLFSVKSGWMTNCTVSVDVHRQELDMYARLMADLQNGTHISALGNTGLGGNNSSGGGGGGGKTDIGSNLDSQTLHIPWRQEALPRHETRPAMPESFSNGYDAYLEDAALEWDSHRAYHAEIDALFAVQASRKASHSDPQADNPSSTAAGIGHTRQNRMRPRKYSEAVMISGGNNPGSLMTDSPGRLADTHTRTMPSIPGSPRQKRRAKYNIKPSDPILLALMNLLTKHFAQPRECNLALTGVLAALVGCPHRTLDLWLGFNLGSLLGGVLSKPWSAWMENLRNISDDENGTCSSDSEGEADPRGSRRIGGAPAAAIATANASKYAGLDRELQTAVRALPSGATPPSLYLVISGLVQQARVLRNEIPDFPRRLKRARNALMGIVEDADDLDEELESIGSRRSESVHESTTQRNRDRGLSSASLENARVASFAETMRVPPSPTASVGRSGNRNRSPSSATAASLAVGVMTPIVPASRLRSGSASHVSDKASNSSVSTGVNNTSRSATHASAAGIGGAPGDASMAGASWHALSVPPANANIAEFLENVIILQESIKEIIARVQVRRENGGDEDAIC
ncbi:hypothetical protein GGI15_000668 [Coemansia interrupta]|uniref:Retinoic acid induced 16-like protein n=1 Tax=Coemansia interrupta TaxID=1126814 RepID=A0A9W8LN96_9FUNG|nr:hypothetical protein GGI15_000668 [Coemansia interrupta]